MKDFSYNLNYCSFTSQLINDKKEKIINSKSVLYYFFTKKIVSNNPIILTHNADAKVQEIIDSN